MKATIEQLSKDWQPVQWTLTHVSCLARTGDTPFEERRTYEFRGTPGQVPSAVQDEDSPGALPSNCLCAGNVGSCVLCGVV